MSKTVELLGSVVNLEFHNYQNNGRTAIHAVEEETGEPYCDVTVNIDHILLRDDEIILRDYGHQSGMHKELQDQGIVGPKLYPARSGHIEATVCRLLINPKQKEL